MTRVEGLVLDFDGTLASGVPEVAIGVLHRTVTQWTPVPLAFVRQYFRTVSSFRMDQSLGLFLDALGLGERRSEVGAALVSARAHGVWTVALDPEAPDFLRKRRPGSVHIFSSAGSRASRFEPLEAFLPRSAFLDYPDAPKSSPETWERLAHEQGWEPTRRVVVDDSPLALWAAKTAGYQTVLKTNSVFTPSDYRDYQPWIDRQVGGWDELDRRFQPRGFYG